MTKTTDLTTGTIWKRLLFFAIPLLLSSLVQQLYNTVDLIFVGNFIDKSASAAIGSSSLLVTCLLGFFGGMSVGSGVVVSHIFGAGETEKLSKAVHNVIALSIAGGLVNIAMDYLFIRCFENGVTGAAWATFCSQGTAALLTVYSLMKLAPAYSLHLRKIGFDREILKKVILIGVPAGAQSLVITLSNVMAQYHINSFGEDAIAAYTAYFKIELIIYLPIVAFGQAIMAFAGQNMGARNYKRMREGTRICLFMSMGLAFATSLLALQFGPQLFRIFNKEPSVIETGCRIIGISFPFYFVYCILQILGDSLRGAGKVKEPMYIVLVNICIIRTILLFLIVPVVQDITGVAVTYPATWILTSVCMLVYYVKYQKSLA